MDQPAALLVTELAPDFARWDELLALILRAFAYMDGVIDPPSSAHLLSPEGLVYSVQLAVLQVLVR